MTVINAAVLIFITHKPEMIHLLLCFIFIGETWWCDPESKYVSLLLTMNLEWETGNQIMIPCFEAPPPSPNPTPPPNTHRQILQFNSETQHPDWVQMEKEASKFASLCDDMN